MHNSLRGAQYPNCSPQRRRCGRYIGPLAGRRCVSELSSGSTWRTLKATIPQENGDLQFGITKQLLSLRSGDTRIATPSEVLLPSGFALGQQHFLGCCNSWCHPHSRTTIVYCSQGIVGTVLPSSEWSEERISANNIGLTHSWMR